MNNENQNQNYKIPLIERDIADLKEKTNNLEEKVDSIRMEFPEIKLMKKLLLGLVGFVLSGFMALIWNTVVVKQQSPKETQIIESISKKILEEYENK